MNQKSSQSQNSPKLSQKFMRTFLHNLQTCVLTKKTNNKQRSTSLSRGDNLSAAHLFIVVLLKEMEAVSPLDGHL